MSRLSRLASIAKLAIDSLRSEHRSAQARKEQKLRAFVDAAKRGLDSRRSALAFRGLDDLREGPPPLMGADEDPEVDLEYEDEDEEPVDDGYTDVELLGRSAAYHPNAWEEIERSQIRVVESSNVYSYAYEAEPGKRGGILYVTFLNWNRGWVKANEAAQVQRMPITIFPKQSIEHSKARQQQVPARCLGFL